MLALGFGLLTRGGPALADEYLYLTGARYFSETGGLGLRYYGSADLIAQGYPLHDSHAPGYAILLGATMALFGHGYATAVGLNLAAFIAGVMLVRSIGRAMGLSESVAAASALVFAVLPLHLLYVYWVLPEVLLGTLFLASLWMALRCGHRRWGAFAAGLIFGVAFLVRESVCFGLPVLVAPLWQRRGMARFLAGAALFLVLVYAPLSRGRAHGGANFWRPSSGVAFGFRAVQEAGGGNLARAASIGWERAKTNWAEVASAGTGLAEKGILSLGPILAAGLLLRWRSLARHDRLASAALLGGWAALTAVTVTFYFLGRWSGVRYTMFLLPLLLLWAVRTCTPSRTLAGAVLAGMGVLSLALDAGALARFNTYKQTRQGRQESLTRYVETYVGGNPERILLENGWHFGWRHYPVEVITDVPEGDDALWALNHTVRLDYVAVPADSLLVRRFRHLRRYQRINTDDANAELFLYRRVE